MTGTKGMKRELASGSFRAGPPYNYLLTLAGAKKRSARAVVPKAKAGKAKAAAGDEMQE
ncbi:hypothetical protein CHLRE_06g306021v5 [Chlamydomonas reinhardtii]|uniref:Uncharacterized protein n=1 Tax=Chlamydomonas reinhardtii TaxID=3055 RepID=A0A2K3DRA7_CHLRE|nr:uncharacterized protein CHLRE_06g306007v5 [Chlamydomonas reinhardtii]XP_042924409.1 uncharacterized protein CHLRE_06g306021v5 [Chlamydomonas reinhardtii]PNW83080.1 hypothetical protein CHLRE_06g306007v5 [Chlamydomonas reinhardtii]PNW83082.1 hypothetical protein CHLRE_06g306021v5 [Chlamydomonas reinhardtii]